MCLHTQGYRHDCAGPLHEVNSLEMKQHELGWRPLESWLLSENAEQGKEHL